MSITDLLIGALALVALLTPGWIVARWAKVSVPLLAAFIASTVFLVALILILDATRMPLTLARCGVAWLGLTVLLAWFARRNNAGESTEPTTARFAWSEHWPLLLALVPAGAVVIYRATAQPLFGIDTVFRWNYLAEQMVAHRALGFYPPVSAADYEIYSWPDGIAPAISALYFWVYSIAHATRPTLTTATVVIQYGLLIAGAFALARKYFSDRAAAFAVALIAASPIVAWATAMGQETGLTALCLVALLLYLPRSRNEENTGAIVIAGIAAGLGALAREYGLALLLLGFVLALARGLSRRAVLYFTIAAALAAFPWYIRNWIHTGNPLFNLDLGDRFAINRIHSWLIESYQVEFGWSQVSRAAWWFLFANCFVALIGGVLGAWFNFRVARPLLAAIAIVVVLWAGSLGYTAAGFPTAMRVLSPALVLASILGGAVLARWFPTGKFLGAASAALGLLAIDAALRALTLPGPVYQIPPGEWPSVGNAVHDYHSRPVYREIARLAGTSRILVLGPNALLTTNGARTVPVWSPEVAFLFDDRLAAREVARRLLAANIGFMVLNQGAANERFLAHSAYFREPGDTLKAMRLDDIVVLRVIAPP